MAGANVSWGATLDRRVAQMLRTHAESAPDTLAIRLKTPEGWASLTWSEYYNAARVAAAVLRDRGVRESVHVLLVDPEPLRLAPALFGVWILGAIPIIAAIPEPTRSDVANKAEYVRRLARQFHAKFVALDPSLMPIEPMLPEVSCISTDSLLQRSAEPYGDDVATSSDVALIQLTSGTTGIPRGVVLLHDKMTAHLERIVDALEFRDHWSTVSWLPLYHDMGLHGGLLVPLYTKTVTALMSPNTFRRRPMLWFESIHQLGATFSGGPPSAFAVMIRLAQRVVDAGLRLDQWECAVTGAEHIPPKLVRSFVETFEPCGFPANAFRPAYGLAECTITVTCTKQDALPRFDHESTTKENGQGSTEHVGLGTPIEGTELRIVDEDGVDVPERETGEIWVRSTTGMSHYYDDPAATEAAFENGWLKTGDVGYTVDGELFVIGRKKDLIIKGGQNYSPAAIEAAVESIGAVRPGTVAAVGLYSDVSMTETVYIVVETASAARTGPDLPQQIRSTLLEFGLPADHVLLVRPRTLPRTTSGKLRRKALAEMIRLGHLETW